MRKASRSHESSDKEKPTSAGMRKTKKLDVEKITNSKSKSEVM
jgi:hypothetical protein